MRGVLNQASYHTFWLVECVFLLCRAVKEHNAIVSCLLISQNLTASNLTFHLVQVKVRLNEVKFWGKNNAHITHISDSEFLQDSKHDICCPLRCLEPKIPKNCN